MSGESGGARRKRQAVAEPPVPPPAAKVARATVQGRAGGTSDHGSGSSDADGAGSHVDRTSGTGNSASETQAGVHHPAFDAAFDVSTLEPDEIFQLALNAFKASGTLEACKVPVDKLEAFLREIRRNYRPNPYHSWTHAVDVLCGVLRLLLKFCPEGVPPIERLALLTCAVCHDVDHPGISNAALVELESEYAILYNDVSPLENRSIFLAARTLRSPSCNFLELVSVPGRRRFRAILCDVVLATDLTDKDREEMNARKWKAVVSSGLDVTNAAHRMALLRTFMTCADIGSTAAPFELFIRWGSRLFHELRATNPSLAATAFAEIQQGFLDKVAGGTWARLDEAGLTDGSFVAGVKSNLAAWAGMAEEERSNLLWHAK